MSGSNHKIWFYINLGLLAVVALAVIVIVFSSSSPHSAPVVAANSYLEQQSSYLNSLNTQLKLLRPMLVGELAVSDHKALAQIKDKLVNLRVPAGYQDDHLNLVLKLSSLEERLTDALLETDGKQPSLNEVKTDLLTLVDEYQQ
ncbi:MAG: hypothetical protein ABIJ81_01045 [Patescibacteria group bacterium]